MQVPLDSLGSFPAGAAATVLVGLIVVAGKYFIDRTLESRRIDLETQRIRLEETRYSSEEERAQWRLRAEMRQEVYTAVGSTKASFFSAALALHDRLSNFFEDPDHTRPWLVLRSSPNEDAPYLRDFVLRLFNFYAWGRITQDALNSLPVELGSV